MNSFKLLVVFTLLFFGIFAQRFQRHLINVTQNGYINGNTEINNLDSLASDEDNYEQYGDDVKLVKGGGKAELVLKYKTLKLKLCSDGCMGKTVIACYDSTNPNSNAKGDCGLNQCEFKAGVSEGDDKMSFLWFYDKFYNKCFPKDGHICATTTTKVPDATSDGIRLFPSCEPLKHDENVKMYVNQVPSGCPFYVENAKIWPPPPPTTTTQISPSLSKETISKSSEANTTLWIGISVEIFILLIVVIGFGYCCYRTQIQKQPQAKPTKKKAPKVKKAPKKPKPPKEITQENGTKEDSPPKKVSVESTLEAPTTEASIVQKSIVQQKQPGNPPKVFVPKKVILPAPKSINAPKSKSLSSKKDSFSGRHGIGMQIMVESSPESLKHHDFNMLNDESKEKLEKVYPPGTVGVFDRLEIELLCCARISIMFKTIEMLVDSAMKALIESGVTFDEKSNIVEMSPKAEKYLQSKSTPEFVRSFAFGNVFREFIEARVHETFSIPLLWTIILQRRYTAYNRRKACSWIRRQLLIIQKEFSPKERSKLGYPICAIEAA
uniref:Uncharacterized protein n=1 Tax=Panagrolaimus davidi TaxID=227884 RepID=A0A914QYB8_9BILA